MKRKVQAFLFGFESRDYNSDCWWPVKWITTIRQVICEQKIFRPSRVLSSCHRCCLVGSLIMNSILVDWSRRFDLTLVIIAVCALLMGLLNIVSGGDFISASIGKRRSLLYDRFTLNLSIVFIRVKGVVDVDIAGNILLIFCLLFFSLRSFGTSAFFVWLRKPPGLLARLCFLLGKSFLDTSLTRFLGTSGVSFL